jgi:hypothetical protein
MPAPEGAKKYVHLIAGTPNDDCPICKAHNVGKAGEGKGKKVGCADGAFVEELSAIDILRCPCPMCAAARQEVLGEEQPDSPA